MPGAGPIPWWLVPNVLALDAPVVAAVWQRFLVAKAGVPVPWAATAALAAAVWAIYLADRLLDARRGRLDAARHRTAARWPGTFAGAALVAALFAAGAAAQLPADYVEYGFAVALGVTAYLALVHAGPRLTPGGKEFLVGVGFAAGVAAPLAVGSVALAGWLPGVVAFGGVCWLNCRLIDRWEAGVNPGRPDVLLGAALLTAAVALPPGVGPALGAAVVGLLLVHLIFRRHPQAARALADAVLLTPLLWWCP
ncbi:hypothetical protein J0H58_06250 [bacterium]|nr:hypothetical protein [bacterium]